MWIDVQGAEKEVFAGACSILPHVNFIYTEFSNRELYKGQPNLEALLGLLPSFRLYKLSEVMFF